MRLRTLTALAVGALFMLSRTDNAESQIILGTCELLSNGVQIGVIVVPHFVNTTQYVEHLVSSTSLARVPSAKLRIQPATARAFDIARDMQAANPVGVHAVEKLARDFEGDREALNQHLRTLDGERVGLTIAVWEVSQCRSTTEGCSDRDFHDVGLLYELLDESDEPLQELWALNASFRYQSADNVTDLRLLERRDQSDMLEIARTAQASRYIHVITHPATETQTAQTLDYFLDAEPPAPPIGCSVGQDQDSNSGMGPSIAAMWLALGSLSRRRRRRR